MSPLHFILRLREKNSNTKRENAIYNQSTSSLPLSTMVLPVVLGAVLCAVLGGGPAVLGYALSHVYPSLLHLGAICYTMACVALLLVRGARQTDWPSATPLVCVVALPVMIGAQIEQVITVGAITFEALGLIVIVTGAMLVANATSAHVEPATPTTPATPATRAVNAAEMTLFFGVLLGGRDFAEQVQQAFPDGQLDQLVRAGDVDTILRVLAGTVAGTVDTPPCETTPSDTAEYRSVVPM